MSGGIEQLMVGGSKPFGMNGLYAHNKSIGGEAHGAVWNVLAVDTVRWIQQSVRPEDFFVLKMDIEGFEHKVIPAMLKANLTGLIDVFAWECHYGIPGSTCHSLHAAAFGMPGFLPTEAVYSERIGSGNFRKRRRRLHRPRRSGQARAAPDQTRSEWAVHSDRPLPLPPPQPPPFPSLPAAPGNRGSEAAVVATAAARRTQTAPG